MNNHFSFYSMLSFGKIETISKGFAYFSHPLLLDLKKFYKIGVNMKIEIKIIIKSMFSSLYFQKTYGNAL